MKPAIESLVGMFQTGNNKDVVKRTIVKETWTEKVCIASVM
jgi:hypothetical protein